MKAKELVTQYPPAFPVWEINEDTNIFWCDLSTLEDQGMKDPWGRKIRLNDGKKIKNSVQEITEYRLNTELEGYPVELVVVNE